MKEKGRKEEYVGSLVTEIEWNEVSDVKQMWEWVKQVVVNWCKRSV